MAVYISTRRCMLGAMALAPMAIATPALAVSRQGEVEGAFSEWKAARGWLNASTDDDGTDESDHPIWERLKRAENVIRHSTETGARVAEIRLWLSMTGDLVYTKENQALHREDVDWLLANAEEPEFSTIMALRAIKALRG